MAHPVNFPRFARVTYAGGELEVRARNSSLNQILFSISRLTGLVITGGVQDQRVFGQYGPAAPTTVISTLLDGTGTDVFLLEGHGSEPARLILTPRSGGPAPPSPNSPVYAAYEVDRNDLNGEETPQRPEQVSVQPGPTQTTPKAEVPVLRLTPEIVAQKLLEMQRQAGKPTSTTSPH